jgi:hypothetical protein
MMMMMMMMMMVVVVVVVMVIIINIIIIIMMIVRSKICIRRVSLSDVRTRRNTCRTREGRMICREKERGETWWW